MRKIYEQDMIEMLYGATLLGAGGGGSLIVGLKMLENLKKDGHKLELTLLDLDEMGDDEYAATVCSLGSPVEILNPDKPAFGPDAVHAFQAFQKAFKAEGKEVKYLLSGEMGGQNTCTPFLVSVLSAENPDKRIPMVDVDCNGRAVPELQTTLTTYWNHPPKPMGMGSMYGDEIIVYPVSDASGEQIARQLCMLYGMRIGFSTWGMSKAEMAEALVPGCLAKAQAIGHAILTCKETGADLMTELKKVMEVREFCRGVIEKRETHSVGGFDCGTTVVKGDDGHRYFIDFKNENLILRDENGKTIMTAPEGIGLIDLEKNLPLTNADTYEGMRLLVTMTPAHPNWWDPERKPYECWLPELRKVGMVGDQVRY